MGVVVSKRARGNLGKLDPNVADRIVAKLKAIERHPHPLELAVPLRNVTIGTHRFRLGQYRVVFEIREGAIHITRIGHRRDVYR